MTTKKKYHYTRIVTTEYLISSILFLIFGIGLGIGMYFSWIASANCFAHTCENECSFQSILGGIVWLILNLIGSFVSLATVFAFLFQLDDLPKIKVKGEGW